MRNSTTLYKLAKLLYKQGHYELASKLLKQAEGVTYYANQKGIKRVSSEDGKLVFLDDYRSR